MREFVLVAVLSMACDTPVEGSHAADVTAFRDVTPTGPADDDAVLEPEVALRWQRYLSLAIAPYNWPGR
jgi:hypothetical protein